MPQSVSLSQRQLNYILDSDIGQAISAPEPLEEEEDDQLYLPDLPVHPMFESKRYDVVPRLQALHDAARRSIEVQTASSFVYVNHKKL